MAEESQGTAQLDTNPLSETFGRPLAAEPQIADSRPRNPDGTFKKTEAETQAVPEVQGHQHPANLIHYARQYGFTQREIDTTPTDSLYAQVTRIYEHQEKARQEAAMQRTYDQQADRTAEARAAVQEPTEDDLLAEIEQEGIHDPRLLKLVKSALQTKKKSAELETALKQRDQRDREKEARTIASMVDDAFEELGADGEAWFGKGSMAQHINDKGQPVTEEGERRNIVYVKAGILAGETYKTIKAKIHAKAKLFMKAPAQPATPKETVEENPYGHTNGKVPPLVKPIATNGAPVARNGHFTPEEWEESATGLPTSRQADELPLGEERAIRNLDAKLRGDVGQRQRISNLGLLK